MKKITILLLLCLSFWSFQSFAQDLDCGTELELTAGQREKVIKTMRTDFQQFKENMDINRVAPIAVPIQIHIVRQTAGTGGISYASIQNEINTYVNPRFAPMNVSFVESGPVNYIDSDTYYSISGSTEGNQMSVANNTANVLNLYFVDYAGGYCGWSRFTSMLPSDYIVMKNSCATNTSTLVHEIGHYFDLYHTHETFFGNELVDGTNCTTAGDLLCDTPADPSLSGLVDASCNYLGNGTDPNGDTYVPDPTQIMSYAPKACRVNFSPDAYAKVLFTIANGRSYLNYITNQPPVVTCTEFTKTFSGCPDYIYANTPSGSWSSIPASGIIATAIGGSNISNLDLSSCVSDDFTDLADMEWGLYASYEENRIPGVSVDIINEIMIRDADGSISPDHIFSRGTIKYEGTPTITCPGNQTESADASCEVSLPDYTSLATANDSCNSDLTIITQNPAPGTTISGTGTVQTVTLRATNAAGKWAECTFDVTVKDTSPPVVACSEFTKTFSGCPDYIYPNTPNGSWFSIGLDSGFTNAVGGSYTSFLDLSCISDNCTDLANMEVTLFDSYEENRIPGASVDIINEFIVRDASGNVSPTHIFFRGTIKYEGTPTITCPGNQTVIADTNCEVSLPDYTSLATASDSCNSRLTVITQYPAPGTTISGNGTVQTVTLRATNAAGKWAECTFDVTVKDTTPPVVACTEFTKTFSGCADYIGANTPSDHWFAIGSDGKILSAIGGSFVAELDLANCIIDNCTDLKDLEVSVHSSYEENRVLGCSVDIINEYLVRDTSGNIADTRIVFRGTIKDTEKPVAPAPPADLNVQCASDVPAPVELTATDNCGDITVSPLEVKTPGACVNDFTLVRTWNFVDGCGNQSSVSQTINVNDTTPPVLIIPKDEIAECDKVPTVGQATATDNCDGNVRTEYLGERRKDGDCINNYTLYRTWTASDKCGNTTTLTQTITVQDTTAPTVTGIINSTFDMGCNIDQSTLPNPQSHIDNGDITGKDNCDGDVTIELDRTEYIENDCKHYVIYYYKAIDVCGNETAVEDMTSVVYFWQEDDIQACAPSYAMYKDANIYFTEDAELNSNNPGWTNYFDTPGEYTLSLFASVTDSDTFGDKSGEVTVNYTGDTVTLEYNMYEPYVMSEAAIYIGCEKYPIDDKGDFTVNPSYYNINTGDLDHVRNYTVGPIKLSNTEAFYVITNPITCLQKCDCSKSADEGDVYIPDNDTVFCKKGDVLSIGNGFDNTAFKAYPIPFENEVFLEYLFNYNTNVTIEVFDLKGALLNRTIDSNYSSGVKATTKLNMKGLSDEMYFVRLTTNRGTGIKKIISQ